MWKNMKKNKSYNEKEIWLKFTETMTENSIIDSVHHPAIFQIELAEYLNKILAGKGKAIEVGCEEGVTSFLLECDARVFFDLNEDIVNKASKAHKILCPNKCEDSFIVGDMFEMPFEDNEFDLVFNAGVLEHFSSDEVVNALEQMARITKPNGKIVVAIPNHYCIVYRIAYLFGIFLDFLHIKTWKWPRENKYYDLRSEIEKTQNLILENRFTLSKKSIWNWCGGVLFPLKIFFKCIDKFCPFEGYLTVLTIAKKV